MKTITRQLQATEATTYSSTEVTQHMQQLVACCGSKHFRRDEELFLSIYTVWLFKLRNLAALTRKQGAQINRLWEQYCK